MGNHEDRLAPGQPGKRRLHPGFVVRVRKGRGLVQNDDGRIFQHDAGDGDALLLAAGEVDALRADHGIRPVGKLFQDIPALGIFQRGQHFLPGGVGPAHAHVVQNGSLEQAAVLEHEGDGVHQLFFRNLPDVHVPYPDRAAVRVEEAGNQVGNGGLAAAGGAHEGHNLSGGNGEGDVPKRFLFSVIAEAHAAQRYRGIPGMPGMFGLRQRPEGQDAVDSLQGVVHNHGVFAVKHDAGQGHGDDGRDEDIQEQIEQKFPGDAVLRKEQRAGNQKNKHAVDGRGIKHHGRPQLPGIGDDPFPVAVDGILELPEGKNGLPEGLDHRDAPHVFHRLIGHLVQRVLVFLHLPLHVRAGHRHHDQKAQQNRHDAQQPQTPVKDQQQHQQPAGRGQCVGTVGKLMGQVRLRRRAGLVDDFPQSAAAKALGKPQRQRYDVMHRLQAQIGGDAERPQVGAHQPRDIHQHRSDRKQHRHPAVVGQMPGAAKIRRDFQHFPDNQPDKIEGHKRDEGADGRKYPGRIAQVFVAARDIEQARQVGSLFQEKSSFAVCL